MKKKQSKCRCRRIHATDLIWFIFFYSWLTILTVIASHAAIAIIDMCLLWGRYLHGKTNGTVFPFLEGAI